MARDRGAISCLPIRRHALGCHGHVLGAHGRARGIKGGIPEINGFDEFAVDKRKFRQQEAMLMQKDAWVSCGP
jgi:hypothetical protein